MELKKIYFDAFKSLLNKEIEIKHNCIGFVGINESGKSNVLLAINVLGGSRKLLSSDTPKMAKDKIPSLRYEFNLTKEETTVLTNAIVEWEDKNTIDKNIIDLSEITLIYNVRYIKGEDKEERFFSINGIKLAENSLILLYEKKNDPYKIKHNELFVPLSNAIILKEANLLIDEAHTEIYPKLTEVHASILNLENEIKSLQEKINTTPVTEIPHAENQEPAQEIVSVEKNDSIQEEKTKIEDLSILTKQIAEKQDELSLLIDKKNEIESPSNMYAISSQYMMQEKLLLPGAWRRA